MAAISALAAIVAHLKADAAVATLVGVRVFGDELPPQVDRGFDMPAQCIVVRRSGGPPPPGSARSYLPLTRSRYDLHCYGVTALESDDVYSAAHIALRALVPATVANTKLYNAIVEGGPRFGRDQDGQWPFTLAVYEIASADDSVT